MKCRKWRRMKSPMLIGTDYAKKALHLGLKRRECSPPCVPESEMGQGPDRASDNRTDSVINRGCSRRHRVRPIVLQVAARPRRRPFLQTPGSRGPNGVSVDLGAGRPRLHGHCASHLDPHHSAGGGLRLHHRRDSRADGGSWRRLGGDDSSQAVRKGGRSGDAAIGAGGGRDFT